MPKAVFFDMDGVLIDSHSSWFEIFNRALDHFENKKIDKDEFDTYVWAKNFTETSKKYFSVPKTKILHYFEQNSEEFENTVHLFDDTLDTLKKLKNNNIIMAVLTNTHTELAKRMLKKAKIIDFFDYIIGGDKVENGKPQPDMIYKALEKLNLKKEDTIFVGDTIWDKKAADAARVRFIGFNLDSGEKIDKLSQLLHIS